METIGTQYIEGVLKGLIRKYYQERMDNVVVAFGKAGDRVVRNIKPLQIRKTSYKSIQAKEERAFAEDFSNPEYTDLEISEPEPVKVALISKEEFDYRKAVDQFDAWNNPLESAQISHTYLGNDGDWESLSKVLFNDIEKSNSYVLVSGFGGSFAQNAHIAFAKLLTEKKIAYISVVIKPSREDSRKRKVAEAGLRELEKIGGKVVICDNQKLIEKQKHKSLDSSRALAKINVEVARRVEVLSARLSNTSELLKYQLTA